MTTKKKTVLALLATAMVTTAFPLSGDTPTQAHASTSTTKISVGEYSSQLKRASELRNYDYYQFMASALRAQYGKLYTTTERAQLEKVEQDYRAYVAYAELRERHDRLTENVNLYGRISHTYLVNASDLSLVKRSVSAVNKTQREYPVVQEYGKEIEALYYKKSLNMKLRFSEKVLFTPSEKMQFERDLLKLPVNDQRSFKEILSRNQERVLEQKVKTGLSLVRKYPHIDYVKEVKNDVMVMKASPARTNYLAELGKLEKLNKRYSAKDIEGKTYQYARDARLREEMLTPSMKNATVRHASLIQKVSKVEYERFVGTYFAGRVQEKMNILQDDRGAFYEDYEQVIRELPAQTKGVNIPQLRDSEGRVKHRVVNTMNYRMERIRDIPSTHEVERVIALADERIREHVRADFNRKLDSNRFMGIRKMIEAYSQSRQPLANEKSYIEREIAKVTDSKMRTELLTRLNTARR